MRKFFVFLLFSLVLFSSLQTRIVALWVPAWELYSAENIDNLIAQAQQNGVNQILAEIRYRGDALYFPNKTDSTFINRESRSYLLKNYPFFDPLEYLIAKTKGKDIAIHAWFTTFVSTLHDSTKMSSDNIFYLKPEWITGDYRKNRMKHDSLEGAYLDPGVPATHLYLLNIILDIVKNYDVAGIHLDYIRYPSQRYGYNEIARKYFRYDEFYRDNESWLKWKEEQVSNFVKKVYVSLKNISPNTVLSAAVFPDPESARSNYSQNWKKWLDEGYLDYVYLMAYTSDNDRFQELVDKLDHGRNKTKIVTGLRAWHSGEGYPVEQINDKIRSSRKSGFAGIALFSYTGIKQNNYFDGLKLK